MNLIFAFLIGGGLGTVCWEIREWRERKRQAIIRLAQDRAIVDALQRHHEEMMKEFDRVIALPAFTPTERARQQALLQIILSSLC